MRHRIRSTLTVASGRIRRDGRPRRGNDADVLRLSAPSETSRRGLAGARSKLQSVADRFSDRSAAAQLSALADAAVTQARGVVQRIPEADAAKVTVSSNSKYHLGEEAVMSGAEAVALTKARVADGFTGRYNRVVYDYDVKNVEEMLYQQLKDDQHVVNAEGHYVVPLPSLNYWLVDTQDYSTTKGGAQVSMRVDPKTMRAYHLDFH